MTCVVYSDRATCPALQSVVLAKQAWAGATGALGAVAICAHTPTSSGWQPVGGGGYSITLTCNTGHTKTMDVHTPEDHRGCA